MAAPLTASERVDAERLAREIVARAGDQPDDMTGATILTRDGVGVSFDWLHVLLARAVLAPPEISPKQAAHNVSVAVHGCNRVESVAIPGVVVKAIALGYYAYDQDGISARGTIATHPVDVVLQTLARTAIVAAADAAPMRSNN